MTRQMTRVLLGLTLVAMLSGCDSGASEVEPSVCAVPTAPPTGTYAPAGQASGGGLEVVDHGFTQLGEGASDVSLGALVRNTSDRIAYRAEVRLRVTDEQGGDAVHPAHVEALNQVIPVIRPGEQVAVGATVAVRDDMWPKQAATYKVASFDVEFGPVMWLPPGDAALFPTFTATFRGIGRDNSDSTLDGVRFSVVSTSCRQMFARGTSVVFLDSSGRVVGGLIDGVGDQAHCGTGEYSDTILEDDLPKGIDAGRTVVTEYCDLARSQWGVLRPSGAPFN